MTCNWCHTVVYINEKKYSKWAKQLHFFEITLLSFISLWTTSNDHGRVYHKGFFILNETFAFWQELLFGTKHYHRNSSKLAFFLIIDWFFSCNNVLTCNKHYLVKNVNVKKKKHLKSSKKLHFFCIWLPNCTHMFSVIPNHPQLYSVLPIIPNYTIYTQLYPAIPSCLSYT